MKFPTYPVALMFIFIMAIYSYLILIITVPERLLISSSLPHGTRLLRDDYDRSVYFKISAWWREHAIPYYETFSEYPQLATYFFAAPALFSNDVYSYMAAHSLFMAVFYVLLVIVVLKLLEAERKPLHFSFLLLLPSFLYFTLNRYDILPSLLTLTSLLLFRYSRFTLSIFFLALGTLTKWYPAVILPLYIITLIKNREFKIKHLLAFTLPIIALAMITLAQGGWDALTSSYRWHLARTNNLDSLLFLINFYYGQLEIATNTFLQPLFLLLQLGAGALPLFFLRKRPRVDFETLLLWATLVVMLFIFFSKYYSPQWIVWFYPLYILSAKSKKMLYLLISFDLANYFVYPVSYALLQAHSYAWYIAAVFTKTVLFVCLILYLVKLIIDRAYTPARGPASV